MRFLWTVNGDAALIINAKDEDAAYECAINHRILRSNQTRSEAESWFEHHDALVCIDGVSEVNHTEGQ